MRGLTILENTSFKYALQQIRHSLRRLNRGNHQEFYIHISKVDVVSSITNQLCQERTLGSSIAFPDGMQFVGDIIEVYDFLHKFIVLQTFEVIAIF